MKLTKVLVAVALVAVFAAGALALAARPLPGGGRCGPKGIYCLDVWDPVECADGRVYSNQCYADRACAPKPCVPLGDVLQ